MALRIHGVIGGPRRPKPVPKKTTEVITKEPMPEVITVTPEKETPEVIIVEEKSEPDFDFSHQTESKPTLGHFSTNVDVANFKHDTWVVLDEDPLLDEDKDFNYNEVWAELDECVCAVCGFKAKTIRGLGAHKRAKHPIVVS